MTHFSYISYMKLELSKRGFIDPISKLQPKQYKQIFDKVCRLLSDPKPQDSTQLKGYEYKNLYRVTIGEFRIIYAIENDTLNILLLGKRNDDEVYKALKRIMQ
jgi:mRNA interferase RelE/StbE